MEQKQRENEEYIARKNAEIAELEEEHEELKARLQELQLITEVVDIGKSLNERIDSLQTVIQQTALLSTYDVNARISNVSDNFHTKLINFSAKLETLELTLMNKLEGKEDRKLTILVLGGKHSNKMHLLNRDRKRWSTLSLKLPTPLYSGGAVYLDGEIFIFGGYYLNKRTYKLNREMEWIQLANMNDQRGEIINSSVAFDGCIWVFGGFNTSEKQLNSVEKYIPEKNKWIQMPSMKEKRQCAAAAACKGKLFVSGGLNGDGILISMECFDPASQKWTMFLDLPSPRRGHAMISDGICLTVLGGKGEEKSVWKINPNEEEATWKELPEMRESRCQFTANVLEGNIFTIGGGGKIQKVEVFDGETWEYGPELPEGIENMCSIVIPAHLAAALSSHQ